MIAFESMFLLLTFVHFVLVIIKNEKSTTTTNRYTVVPHITMLIGSKKNRYVKTSLCEAPIGMH